MIRLLSTDISDIKVADETAALYRYLNSDDRATADSIKNSKERILFIAGRLLLKFIAKTEGICDLTIAKNEYGKPYADGVDLEFNISHSGSVALIGFGRSPLGCDVEMIGKYRPGVIGRFFSDEEKKYFESVDERRRTDDFYTLWTLKESFVKAIGTGLNTPLSSFSLRPDLTDQSIGYDGATYRLRSYKTDDGYKYAVCVSGDEALPVQIEKKDLRSLLL